MKSDILDIEVRVLATTPKAVRVWTMDVPPPGVWLPRSQIEIDTNSQDGLGEATISLPKWLAEERGLA